MNSMYHLEKIHCVIHFHDLCTSRVNTKHIIDASNEFVTTTNSFTRVVLMNDAITFP